MKKLVLFLSLPLALALAGCGNNPPKAADNTAASGGGEP
jgi:hypothetical protein